MALGDKVEELQRTVATLVARVDSTQTTVTDLVTAHRAALMQTHRERIFSEKKPVGDCTCGTSDRCR